MYYKRRTDVTTRIVDGETLVLDEPNGLIHQLNVTASFVWSQCDGKVSKTGIVQQLVDQFDVELSVADRDVSDVIKKFFELKLLED